MLFALLSLLSPSLSSSSSCPSLLLAQSFLSDLFILSTLLLPHCSRHLFICLHFFSLCSPTPSFSVASAGRLA